MNGNQGLVNLTIRLVNLNKKIIHDELLILFLLSILNFIKFNKSEINNYFI